MRHGGGRGIVLSAGPGSDLPSSPSCKNRPLLLPDQHMLVNTASGSDSGTETMGCVGTCPGPPFLLPTLLLLPTHLYTHDSWLLKSEHKAVKAPAIKISASFYLAANCQLPFKEYQEGGLKKKKIPHTALTNVAPYIKASGRNTGFHLALMKPAYPSLEMTELHVAQWSIQREGSWRWVAG